MRDLEAAKTQMGRTTHQLYLQGVAMKSPLVVQAFFVLLHTFLLTFPKSGINPLEDKKKHNKDLGTQMLFFFLRQKNEYQ